MFKITMLPAGWGDCLWIEYGPAGAPTKRILIDGGIGSTYKELKTRIELLGQNDRHFELLIVTHIDADHIEGAVKLLGSISSLGVSFGDVWFNGFKHLPADEAPDHELGGAQGEFLSALIQSRGLPWNKWLKGEGVRADDTDGPRVIDFGDGMKLTILLPTRQALRNLRSEWKEAVKEAGLNGATLEEVLKKLSKRTALRPVDDLVLGTKPIDVSKMADSVFVADASKPNGSSITVLAEFEEKRILLTGDAHAHPLQSAIAKLAASTPNGRLKLNAMKMPHHGSSGNISIPVLKLLDCSHYLFSSNGKKHHHPDPETVARVIRYGGKNPSLHFNYRSPESEIWEKLHKTTNTPFEPFYPKEGETGLTLPLSP